MWQDYVLFLGAFVFIASLIPSITSNEKPNKCTSFFTSFVLLIYSGVYVTLDLYISSIIVFLTSFGWMILFVQSYYNNKKGNK
jgi:hypothetical protein